MSVNYNITSRNNKNNLDFAASIDSYCGIKEKYSKLRKRNKIITSNHSIKKHDIHLRNEENYNEVQLKKNKVLIRNYDNNFDIKFLDKNNNDNNNNVINNNKTDILRKKISNYNQNIDNQLKTNIIYKKKFNNYNKNNYVNVNNNKNNNVDKCLIDNSRSLQIRKLSNVKEYATPLNGVIKRKSLNIDEKFNINTTRHGINKDCYIKDNGKKEFNIYEYRLKKIEFDKNIIDK